MLDEIDDRRHSRTDRSEWIRQAVQARLAAEDRSEWDEIAPAEESDDSSSQEVEKPADA
jgi:metal-responsive CopG/Arc/MetJ family transcriptional regulator